MKLHNLAPFQVESLVLSGYRVEIQAYACGMCFCRFWDGEIEILPRR